jgi:geranylgeranyl diphosphate synthase, type I
MESMNRPDDPMQKRLRILSEVIDTRLRRFFEVGLSEFAASLFPGAATDAIDAEVRDLTLRGGKRLRAALVVCGYELFQPDGLKVAMVLDAAAAMELLQTGFLIHDDIMDDDSTRRGGPSAHVSLARKTGSTHAGRNLAILAGDLALAMACGLMSDLPATTEVRTANALFSQMHLDVIRGQEQDLNATASPEDIALHKTASYTTTGPLCIGAALAGVEESQLRQVAAVARPLGLAFQYRDDIIGILGDPAKTGKPVGSDLIHRKNTLVMVEARRHATGVTARKLANLSRADFSDPDVMQNAIALLVETGALDSCERRIRALREDAEAHLNTLCPNPDGRQFLDWLMTRLVSRIA